jgi:hypothetical protein
VLFAIRFWRFGDCIRVMLASDPGGGATAKKG